MHLSFSLPLSLSRSLALSLARSLARSLPLTPLSFQAVKGLTWRARSRSLFPLSLSLVKVFKAL
jgi:hypothetical protein